MQEKYATYPQEKLVDVMKMLTIAIMRPDLSLDALRVRTYKEMLDLMMIEVARGSTPQVIVDIEKELREKFHAININSHGNNIPL